MKSDFTARFEGFSPVPYQDPRGVWTIAFGATRDIAGARVTAATPSVTREEGKALLERDLTAAWQAVAHLVLVPLNNDQETALADFVYNVGAGAFAGSRVLSILNGGEFAAAAAQLMQWNLAAGKVFRGLVRRRAEEILLFLSAPLSGVLEGAQT